MNTFKRKILAALAAVLLLGACTSDKQYAQLVQDTNDRIERAKKQDADADAAFAAALTAAAAYEPGLVAAVTSNVLMARALKGSRGSDQTFVMPERPRDFFDKLESVSRSTSNIVNSLTPIGLAMEAGRTARAGYQRDVGIESLRQGGETSRIQSVAQISRDVAAGRPNQTFITGRDANFGGSQANNNSSVDRHDTACNAGAGATGGGGGSGGSGGAGATSPGAAGATGAAGGSGGDAC